MGMILHAEKFISLCLVANKSLGSRKLTASVVAERDSSHVAFHFTLLGLGLVSVVTFQSLGALGHWKLQV